MVLATHIIDARDQRSNSCVRLQMEWSKPPSEYSSTYEVLDDEEVFILWHTPTQAAVTAYDRTIEQVQTIIKKYFGKDVKTQSHQIGWSLAPKTDMIPDLSTWRTSKVHKIQHARTRCREYDGKWAVSCIQIPNINPFNARSPSTVVEMVCMDLFP